MKLYVKNKVVSIGGGSAVVDENNQPLFTVKGKVFTISDTKKIYTLDNQLLFRVRKKHWTWFNRSALIYDADGQKIARVSYKDFQLIKQAFVVQGYGDEIKAEGLGNARLTIVRNGKPIGKILRDSSLLVRSLDSFCVEVEEEIDAPFLVALVIAIDIIQDSKHKR